jgi:pimeloyl-ACP methyl ester carboxylesterase
VITILAALALAIVAAGIWLWTPDLPRGALEAKYFDAQSSYVEVDGARLHVRDSGPRTAPAVILLHGFGSSLHTWEPWAQSLAGDFRVVRIDLPGSGLTGADPTGDYTDARGTKLLAALMDKLSIPRASLIGNSVGGRLAWKFAAQYPERVDKLVLISPDGFASPGFEYGKRPAVPALFKLVRYALPKVLLRMNLAPAYGDPEKLTDATVTRYHDLMLAPGVRAASIERMEQTVLEPPEPLLAKIRAPALLLWGERDAMIPYANAQDYLKALPGSTLVALPGLGHVPFEEAPAASLVPVRAFLMR